MNKTISPILSLILCGSLSGCASSAKRPDAGSLAQEAPKLVKPLVKKIWIPPEIRNGGNEWVEGHYLYRIEKETTWSR